MNSPLNILITTGVYPPKIGGPAQYAKNLKIAFEKSGNTVSIQTFNFENYLPSGIRHIYFFIKIFIAICYLDKIFDIFCTSTLACYY